MEKPEYKIMDALLLAQEGGSDAPSNYVETPQDKADDEWAAKKSKKLDTARAEGRTEKATSEAPIGVEGGDIPAQQPQPEQPEVAPELQPEVTPPTPRVASLMPLITPRPEVEDQEDQMLEQGTEQAVKDATGFTDEYPNFWVGAAPMLMGALLGDLGAGAKQGGDALIQRYKDERDASQADIKFKRDLASKEKEAKPLTKSNIVETLDAQGNPIYSRIEQAVGQRVPGEEDKFHLDQKMKLESHKASLKDKAEKGFFKDEQSLRKEYKADGVIKNTQLMGQALSKMQSLSKSGASDVAMMISYMKILDPTSVVSPGEQATAKNAGAVPDSIRNMYNRLMLGEDQVLPQKVRANFLKHAQEMYGSQVELKRGVDASYNTLATEYGFDPSRISITTTTPIERAPINAPPVGKVDNGYKFKGGNPNDKNNWEKQ